jgi:primosomal protein N' (replication factor Y)
MGQLMPGHLTTVPFGNRIVQAVVLRLIDSAAVAETKSLLELVDPDPVLTVAQISLAEWMAETTLAPLSALIGLFLPPGIDQQADTLYAINPRAAPRGESAASQSRRRSADSRLIELLGRRGPLRGRQIDRALPHVDWRKSAQYLVRSSQLTSHSVLPPVAVRPKLIRTAQLAAAPDVAATAMDDLGRTEVVRLRRKKALELLIGRPQAINVSWVYAESGCNSTDLQELAERELILLREQEIWRDPLNKSPAGPAAAMKPGAAPLALTSGQQTAWRAIESQLVSRLAGEAGPSILLQGVTGSGKTELYLQATAAAARRGRQTIMLVPEIALTPQTVDRFVTRFPGQVGLIHSRLSPGERYDTWRRARSGALKVIIGPRSALFAPLQDLGLIIADECHDTSYHQSEPPFYDGSATAEAYARISGGLCILGSATPSVVQRYQSEIGRAVRLQLTQRIASASETQPAPQIALPRVDIVDLREELKAGNRGVFSRKLTTSLEAVLRNGEQAILFLNRRGTATYVFCRNCGYVARCPRCDTPLTYHSARPHDLLCHRCGYERQMPKTCPDCGKSEIRAYGLGTEKVEAEVQSAFPGARTLRWDWETTRQKDAHEIILHHFANGHADVLIGTQMLAKGLDLPRVTLVGIIVAEPGLFLPDPFAAERVFQLLTQVAGRAGRSARGGRVILQTFVPESHVIQAAAAHDVEGFFGQELAQRRRLGYPPFARLLRLEYRHFDPTRAEQAARDEATRLAALLDSDASSRTTLIGPAPCFFSKVDGKYRWQIVLRGASFGHLFQGQRLQDWRLELDPVSLL